MKKFQNLSKRSIPSIDILNWRERYLNSIINLDFEEEYKDAPLLEKGNSKIGEFSDKYDKVFVWNLPVVITCPAASKWCLKHCYNADPRKFKFPINDWNKNLQFFLNNPEVLKSKLLNILNQDRIKQAVRIHSSGDFFSADYIDFWSEIIHNTPNVNYWAYTRSWNNPDLIIHLNKLKENSNIQLFASWDSTMPPPPIGWRKSIVYQNTENLPDTGIICPEQSGKASNCATCNYCLINKENKNDVYFILH